MIYFHSYLSGGFQHFTVAQVHAMNLKKQKSKDMKPYGPTSELQFLTLQKPTLISSQTGYGTLRDHNSGGKCGFS